MLLNVLLHLFYRKSFHLSFFQKSKNFKRNHEQTVEIKSIFSIILYLKVDFMGRRRRERERKNMY